MKRTALLLIFSGTVMLLVFCLTSSLYSQQQSVKVGVVDLKLVSENFDKWKRLAGQLDSETEKSNQKLAEMGKEIEKLQEMEKQFKPGSDKHKEIQIALSTKDIEMKSFLHTEQNRLKEIAEKLGGELLNNIEAVIKQYGRKEGYTLIIKKEEMPVQNQDWMQLRNYVSRKSVMYYSADIDLTNKIVKELNENYK
jgi:Skp family chaperone for outer membrane proteins